MNRAGGTSLGPEQLGSQGWTVLRLREQVGWGRKGTLRLALPGPSAWAHRPDPGRASDSKARSSAPKGDGPCGLQDFEGSLGLYISWCPPASFLRVTLPTDNSSLITVLL